MTKNDGLHYGRSYHTSFECLFEKERCNHRLLFGHPKKIIRKEFIAEIKTHRKLLFNPGQIFAIELWERNAYGTSFWAVYVLQACGPGETVLPIPHVSPGAKVLLEARGKERSKRALKMIDEMKERIDPALVSANRFLLTDFRLKALSSTSRSRC